MYLVRPNFMTFIFCRGCPIVFVKLKDNKIVSGFCRTQHYILFYFILFYFILFFLDNMFQSNYHHQAAFTKLGRRYMLCKQHSHNMRSYKTYNCINTQAPDSCEPCPPPVDRPFKPSTLQLRSTVRVPLNEHNCSQSKHIQLKFYFCTHQVF